MLHPPGLWSSAWRCDAHGDVDPFHAAKVVGEAALRHTVEVAKVPVWLPWPLPLGWLLTGIAHAGDERTGARGTAVACSGPSELGGPAELVLIAESAGVGLGAFYSGLDSCEPRLKLSGSAEVGAFEVKVHAAGHPTALWPAESHPDRAVLSGEAFGVWLTAVVWPPSSSVTALDELELHDLRKREAPIESGIPYGALSPRL
jgi:hypothetical protein